MMIVDTNIIAYRAIPGPRSEDARRLALRDSVWVAPPLWRSVFRNVLAGFIRRRTLTLPEATEMAAMAGTFLTGGEPAVADLQVLELVARSSCTSYDCEFVALAIMLDVRLVTEDRELLKAFPQRCRSLEEILAA